jgi:hypothetical protein
VDRRLENWKVILGTALEGECNSLREIRRGSFLWLHCVARPGAKNWQKLERQDNSLAYHAALRIADVYCIQVYLFSEEATRVRRVVWCNKLLQQKKQNLYIYIKKKKKKFSHETGLFFVLGSVWNGKRKNILVDFSPLWTIACRKWHSNSSETAVWTAYYPIL